MLIKNPEALKSWLVVILEPLCDADSSALARYVLALLKKEKPEKDLRRVMIEQLDVFLAEETTPFVERLFHAIISEEYLNTPVQTELINPASDDIPANDVSTEEVGILEPPETETTPMTVQATPVNDVTDKLTINPPPEETQRAKEYPSKTSDAPEARLTQHTTKATSHALGTHVRSASPPVRAAADKENQPRENRRRRASLRSRTRSRSRSRSNERVARRSRSRGRVNDREKVRQFRNKSPPSLEQRHVAVHDRRRGGGGRRLMGGHGGERSPRFGNNGHDGGRRGGSGPGGSVRPIRSNSRSRSPSVERGRNKQSPPVRRNSRATPERAQHQLAMVTIDSEGRQRCRDFDEKGYCVRGETCPWDHGVNPVIFDGLNNPALISMSMREYNPDAPDLWTRTTTVNNAAGSAGPAPPMAAGMVFNAAARQGGVVYSHPIEKDPNNPAEYTRNGASFRGAGPMIPGFPFNPAAVTTPLQRELIPIPVVDAGSSAGGDVGAMQQKRRYELEDTVAIAEGPSKRKVPINSRLGPRVTNIQNNCALELRKVPRGLNTIAHLNNHFAKFGKIVNIQISYDGDPEAAIITFSTHAEANVAYRSTEAVLNNRFIKVFWHTPDSNAAMGTEGSSPSSGGRKNSQYHLNNIPAVPTPTADSAKISNVSVASAALANATNPPGTEPNPAPVAAVATPSLRLKNNVPARPTPAANNAIIRKKQEEQAKAVVQLANGLRKRKQELLQSYVKQMKSAIELVERCEANDPQRVTMLETVKTLQQHIDKLHTEIAAEQEQVQTQLQSQQPPPKKTKEQQKKELLDIELELIAQQQEGNDTTAIQKRLEELQRSLGVHSSSAGLTAGGQGMPSGGGAGKMPHYPGSRPNTRLRASLPEGSTRVDRRPKTIVITGFASEEADFVLGHFKHFGEITKHDLDKDIPQLILSYATRINAEQAVLRGKLFKDKRLHISWAPVISMVQPTAGNSPLGDNNNKSNDAGLLLNAEPNKVTSPIFFPVKCGSEMDSTTDTLPELRLEDEEEEEESEDRTWRR